MNTLKRVLTPNFSHFFPKTKLRVAVCTLNQWAMDFEQNKLNIMESLRIARDSKCTLRVGPELEIPGYGCEDHFLEADTVLHSWQVLAEILSSGLTQGLLCDFGMALLHKSVLYNCRIVCLDQKILLIRPKIMLADNGNYREPRWFTSWKGREDQIEDHVLPQFIQEITQQRSVPFGNAVIETQDNISLGYEICEEMWVPRNMSTQLALDGVEIIMNPSGSHYERHKQKRRTDLILGSMRTIGGIYLYSNVRGCDGGRVYYDGNSIVAQNGKLLEMSDMFSLKEVDVIVRDVDVAQVRQFRQSAKTFGLQTTYGKVFQRVRADINLAQVEDGDAQKENYLNESQYLLEGENEISWGPSCYLWDYLKKSGAMGYFLALSGGADSASTALIVYNMCHIVFESIKTDPKIIISLRKIVRDPDYTPIDAKDICSKLLFTGYMATDNSSLETRDRAALLSKEINCTHYNLNIQEIVNKYSELAKDTFKAEIRYKSQGGSPAEDLALQNIQARSRMILAYLMGGLIPWHIRKNGYLLVLGSANLDEGLRGYMTKYDCSSADVNPIGSISKMDINNFLKWNYEKRGIVSAKQILDAKPTAELRPLGEDKQIQQTDEEDMGVTYKELQQFGILRKVHNMGPFSMFEKLIVDWHPMPPKVVADKVMHFFYYYAVNRHKLTTITPAYHAEGYSIDDNRFDLRQFLYNPQWTYQVKMINQRLQQLEEQKAKI